MSKNFIRMTDTDGKVYELTYTRETIKQMEAEGFKLSALADGSMIVTMQEMLFQGAFKARHRKLSRKVMEDIYAHIGDKDVLRESLLELYAATMEPLIETASAEDGKNVTWEVV